MKTINISDELYNSLKEYCDLNELVLDDFVTELINARFMVAKYGDAPPFFKKKESIKVEVEKEKIPKVETIQIKEEPKVEAKETPVENKEEVKQSPTTSKKAAARNRVKYL